MNIQANDRKQINTAVLDHLFTQGEAGADVVSIHLPLRYGQADLAALVWSVQLVSEKDSFVSKALEKEVAEEELILRWTVDEDCTAVSGKVSVTVVGVSEDGGTVIKFDGNRIFIKEAAYGSFTPTPDTMAAALLQVQKAAEEAASAAKSANEDAQAAQKASARSPYIGEDGYWYVFDGESGMYQKSDIAAAGPAGPAGPKGDPGGVLTVNGQSPDGDGNVNVQAGVTSVFGREGAVTAQPGDYNISQITGAVRPNLLDNWYFGNPVNQRGQTEYDGVGAYPYAFDRWIARGSVLTLVDGGVEIGTGGAQVNNIALQTSIENTENLVGKKVTISFLISENNATNDTYVGIFYGASSVNMTLWALQSAAIPAGATGLFSATGVLPDMGTHKAMNPCLRVQGTQSGSLKVTAAKLEIGEGQTLAHQDADGNWVLNEIPDYAEELAKCQRYQVIMSGLARYRTILVQANSLDFYIPTPVTMRAVPAFSVPTARITSFTSSASFTDATWSVVNINPAGVYLRATKSDHGFTDARADLEGGAIFDANL
ncbi:MAG: hypothetical protein IJM93_01150 [Oscillospiraceae bacterium]|nr:hypothetical protein [Oscillospiraceae bacterium]